MNIFYKTVPCLTLVNKRGMEEARRCPVCLESDDALLPTGCACRGSAGLAHPRCIAQAAGYFEDSQGPQRWIRCSECGQRYGGRFQKALLDAMVKRTDSPDVPWWRKSVARLWRGISHWEQHDMIRAESDIQASLEILMSRPEDEREEPLSQRQLRDIQYHLGMVYSDTGRYDEAMPLFEAASSASEGSVVMYLSDLEIAKCMCIRDSNEKNMFRYVRMSNALIQIFNAVINDERKMYQVALRSLEFVLSQEVPISVVSAAQSILESAQRLMGPEHVDTCRARAVCARAQEWARAFPCKRKRRAASLDAAKKIRTYFKR